MRIRDYDETGQPEPGTLTAETARRLTYMRDQWLGDALHQVFRDHNTKRVYAVPTGEVHTPAAVKPRGVRQPATPTPAPVSRDPPTRKICLRPLKK